ncbi:DUF6264 family protein [Microbacterium sp. NPDC019599]|uniref:DUF6264 family protein n=1 Tax=Microbacterium sp. NPDC019599 TaxID=3154690 RepID=UPI0034002083
MSDSAASQPDPRPRPAYGEYATPEEQRARIQQPDATWALETGQAPEDVAESASGWPVDTSPAPPVPASRGVDRAVTLALLAIGAFNVIATAISYFDLAGLADQAMRILGVPGEFTNVESAQLWGPIAAVVLVAGFVVTALLAWRRLRAGRLSWWVPVVGAVVTYIFVYVCISIPLLGDPAFTQFATTLS